MYTQDWGKAWLNSKEEVWLTDKILSVFESYLSSLIDRGVSKSTFNRHKAACHALGGYIAGEVFGYENDTFSKEQTGIDILLHYIDESGGPLVYRDNEVWQKELDAMCRKLCKYIKAQDT